MIELIRNEMKIIIEEMAKGNFSFLIVLVGILQLIEMKRKGK